MGVSKLTISLILAAVALLVFLVFGGIGSGGEVSTFLYTLREHSETEGSAGVDGFLVLSNKNGTHNSVKIDQTSVSRDESINYSSSSLPPVELEALSEPSLVSASISEHSDATIMSLPEPRGSGRAADHRRFLYDSDGKPRGNGRCIVPLLLTDAKYHGTRLLATTLKGWVTKLLLPQKNLDLVIYYDVTHKGLLADIIQLLALQPAAATNDTAFGGEKKNGASDQTSLASAVRPEALSALSPEDATSLGEGGYFSTPHDTSFRLRVLPTVVPLPLYVQREPELLNRTDWMRCGCPPYCPVKRATVGYIQGTRWYTYDLFLEPAIVRYSYWMKVDVDIWIFRELNISIVEEMRKHEALVGHTGLAYNGGGCSNDLHRALVEYYGCSYSSIANQHQGRRSTICAESGRIKSANSSWWKQDDGVYYTNFVVYSVPFFMDKEVMALSQYLNEFRDGFFRWRWTDQSLAHKVLGVFAGPDEDSFRLDWSYLRWKRGSYRPKAAFWHGKSSKGRRDLKKYTDL